MIERGKLQKKLTHRSTDINENILKLPLVEIVGCNRVLIENHMGVCDYGTQQIIIRVPKGSICVCGKQLELSQMTKEVLVVTGLITSVVLHGGIADEPL